MVFTCQEASKALSKLRLLKSLSEVAKNLAGIAPANAGTIQIEQPEI